MRWRYCWLAMQMRNSASALARLLSRPYQHQWAWHKGGQDIL